MTHFGNTCNIFSIPDTIYLHVMYNYILYLIDFRRNQEIIIQGTHSFQTYILLRKTTPPIQKSSTRLSWFFLYTLSCSMYSILFLLYTCIKNLPGNLLPIFTMLALMLYAMERQYNLPFPSILFVPLLC